MYKSQVSREKRRAMVRTYHTGQFHYICLFSDHYRNVFDIEVGYDLRRAINETMRGSSANTLPTVVGFGMFSEKQRDNCRKRWLSFYAEKGIAYNWVEWVWRMEPRFKKWMNEVVQIAAQHNMVQMENPPIEDMQPWVARFAKGINPQEAWDNCPWIRTLCLTQQSL